MSIRPRSMVNVQIALILLGAITFTLHAASPATSDGHFCGGGVTTGVSLTVLCQEMPPFPIINDVKIGVIQEGPETSPTVVTIDCSHVVWGEVFKGYTLRPATIYAAVSTANRSKRYLVKIVDSGLRSDGTGLKLDRAGVRSITELSLDDGFCGASGVPTTTLIGNFYTRSS